MHIYKMNQGWLLGESMASFLVQSYLSEVPGTEYSELVYAVLILPEYVESQTRGSFHENAQFCCRYTYRTKQLSINDIHSKSKTKFRIH